MLHEGLKRVEFKSCCSQLLVIPILLSMVICIVRNVESIFLNHFESKYFNSRPPDCKIFIYRLYLNDTFILFVQKMNFINFSIIFMASMAI